MLERIIGSMKTEIGTGHNATEESLMRVSQTNPQVHAIAKRHSKEVQTVYNPTSHTSPDATQHVSKVAEAIIQHGLLEGEAVVSDKPRWYTDVFKKGWDVIQRGYIQKLLETMPLTFYRPFAGGDVRPVQNRGAVGSSGAVGVVLGAAAAAVVAADAATGLDEAIARLDQADDYFRRQDGDVIFEFED